MDGGAGDMPGVSRSRASAVADRPSLRKLWLRRARRVLKPPAVALVLFGGVLLYAVVADHGKAGPNGTTGPLRAWFARATAALGFTVSEVLIEGRTNTPEPLLRAALGVAPGEPIFGFSVAAARARIETLSWVANASVERRWPSTIVVALTERRPFAIWQHEGKFRLIDRQGQVVQGEDLARFRNLPLVVGAGAPAHAAEILDALGQHPQLAEKVTAAIRVGERRWNLHLASGLDVLLPEGHEAAALERLEQLEREHGLLERPLQIVDMRLPDRLVLRPASAPRAETEPVPPQPPSSNSKPPGQQAARRPT